MLSSFNVQLQQAFRKFASTDGWAAPHGLTLTMKQGRMEGATFLSITPQAASRNMGFFLNRLNKHIYGNAAVRYGKRVPIIPVVEGGGGKRLHYHAIVDCPRDDLRDGYPALLNTLWLETPWGHHQTHTDADIDGGWKNYISKLRDKPDYADSVDWANYHNIDR